MTIKDEIFSVPSATNYLTTLMEWLSSALTRPKEKTLLYVFNTYDDGSEANFLKNVVKKLIVRVF